MENESARGSKKEGKKRRPETEHSLPKLRHPNNRLSAAAASADLLTLRKRR
jgi:hypothetical protein